MRNIVSAVIGEQIEEAESLVKVKAREANRNVRAPLSSRMLHGATFHSMTQEPLYYCPLKAPFSLRYLQDGVRWAGFIRDI